MIRKLVEPSQLRPFRWWFAFVAVLLIAIVVAGPLLNPSEGAGYLITLLVIAVPGATVSGYAALAMPDQRFARLLRFFGVSLGSHDT